VTDYLDNLRASSKVAWKKRGLVW